MKIVGLRRDQGSEGQGFGSQGIKRGDLVLNLEATMEFEKGFLGDDEAVFFENISADEGIGDAGFIFEADKKMAFGGGGTLAADDKTGDGDELFGTAADKVGSTPYFIG